MKKLNVIIAILWVIFVALGACKKDKEIMQTTGKEDFTARKITKTDKTESEVAEVLYFLDNLVVDKNLFDIYKTNIEEPYIIHSVMKESKTDEFVEVFYGFSDKEKYIEHGKINGLNLKGQLEFEKHMRKYAEESGAIHEFEKNGKIPESYLICEENYRKKIFGTKKEEKNIAFFLYEYCSGGQYIALLPHHSFPVLPNSWKNRISFVNNIGLVGLISFYDKSFYRSRLETVNLYVTNWTYCFSGTSTDNSAESVHAW